MPKMSQSTPMKELLYRPIVLFRHPD